MKRVAFIAGSLSLVACSATLRRPVETTEAASGLEQVTVSGANELDPAVSPDASAVAYEVAPALDAEPHVEVMSLTDLGTTGSRTVVYSSATLAGVEPSWMPDGSSLLFLTRHPERSMPAPATLIKVSELIPGGHPFASDVGDYSFAGEWPAVAPDGATVVMSVGRLGVFATGWRATRHYGQALAMSDLVGTGVTAIGEGTEPAWSPDGKRLAFVREQDGHGHLFVASADGGGAQQVTYGPADDDQPSWSPDGRRIVFCSAHATEVGRQANLFTVQPDGERLIQLTEGDSLACRPVWGRDGYIYFHANVTDRFHIWRIRPT